MKVKAHATGPAIRRAARAAAALLSFALLSAVTQGLHIDRLGNAAPVLRLDSFDAVPMQRPAGADGQRGQEPGGASRAGWTEGEKEKPGAGPGSSANGAAALSRLPGTPPRASS